MNLPPSNCAGSDVLRTRVAVIGNGPAGIAAACVLAQAGVDTLLIGQSPGNSLKAGESLPGAALRLLRRLGINTIQTLLTPDAVLGCTANASAWGEENWTRQEAIFNPEGGGWHLLRHHFDAMLLEHARAQGVQILTGACRTLAPHGCGHRLQVATIRNHTDADITLQADFLIDATGRKAWLARRLGGPPVKLSRQLAVVGWMNGLTHDQDNSTRLKSVADGWWYSARLPQGLRVAAFHGLPRAVVALSRYPEAFRAACNASGVLPFSLQEKQCPLKLRTCDASVTISSQLGGENWLAVGDAALSFDPLSSQGIYFALYSGIRGAEAALDCLHSSALAADALTRYRSMVLQVFESNQRTRRLFYTRELRYRDHAYWQAQRQ